MRGSARPCLWVGEASVARTSATPKCICRCNTKPTKTPRRRRRGNGHANSEIHRQTQGPRMNPNKQEKEPSQG